MLETFASEIGGALESTRLSEKIGRDEAQAEKTALARPTTVGLRPRFGDFLTVGRIRFVPGGLTEDRIVRDLLARMELPNATQAFQAIMEREKSGPTLIGTSVAVPHARLEEFRGLCAAVGLSPEGPVKVWVVFVSGPSNPKLHLGFLSAVSTFFLAPGRVDALLSLKSPKALLDYIRQEEEVPPSE